MKVYTGGGDHGQTSLFSGERVAKSNDRIEAYGDVDELNAVLGLLSSAIPEEHLVLVEEIHMVQSDLFHIGAWLATTPGSADTTALYDISEEKIVFLETAIDRMEEELDPLSSFILPGGHAASATAHVARTVCRRAERRVVYLLDNIADTQLPLSVETLRIYLNRLSDYLFVFARYCNLISGVQDITWKKDTSPRGIKL